MNFELEKRWRETVAIASKHFGETLDMQSILFILGIQELNKGYVDLSKDEKLEVMHIATCTLLDRMVITSSKEETKTVGLISKM